MIAAKTNARIIEGPERPIASPIMTNIPVPTIAPIPIAEMSSKPTTRRSLVSAAASAMMANYSEAVVHYRAALALVPDLIGVDYNLGVALERSDRADEALVHFRRAVELDPADVEAAAAVVRLEGE